MYKILVIDDLVAILRIIESQLSGTFDVQVETLGQEAIQLINTKAYDCVVMDLYLSDIDGLELLKLLVSKKIPTLVLSGRQGTDIRIECLELGANDFLVKPFHPKELSLRILNILKLKNSNG